MYIFLSKKIIPCIAWFIFWTSWSPNNYLKFFPIPLVSYGLIFCLVRRQGQIRSKFINPSSPFTYVVCWVDFSLSFCRRSASNLQIFETNPSPRVPKEQRGEKTRDMDTHIGFRERERGTWRVGRFSNVGPLFNLIIAIALIQPLRW